MPPRGRGRGGSAGWGGRRAASAASADPGAGPSTSGRSGPASQLSLLPAPLLRACRALPVAAEALLPAAPSTTQPPGGGCSAAGRGRGAGNRRVAALREGKEQLSALVHEIRQLPYPSSPQHAIALAQLVATHPAETAALLRLHSAALRPDGEGKGGGGSGGGSGHAGAPVEALALEGWRADALKAVAFLVYRFPPFPASRHALSLLLFVLALLRAQTLPALSRRLAAAASGAPSGAAGVAECMQQMGALTSILNTLVLREDGASAALPADEVASLRAVCVEELARGLAESGTVELAARAVMLLQARGQHRPPAAPESHTLGGELLFIEEELTQAAARNTHPAAAAHLRSVLRGRCLQTAVLVYGVGTLRLLDVGAPSYGLPPALQTAGLSLCRLLGDDGRKPSAAALEGMVGLCASPHALPPLGPRAALELALRMGWAMAAVAAKVPPPNLSAAPVAGVPLPRALGAALCMPPVEGARLAVTALNGGRQVLRRRQREGSPPPPRLAAQRHEWWRLAACTAVYGMWDAKEYTRRWLWVLVTKPILAVWPDGRLDLDSLPPEPPAEVAAALAAGLLPALAALPDLTRTGPASSSDEPEGPYEELLDACQKACPDGFGLALFLAPLLAYGEPGQAEGLLGALGRAGGLLGPSGGGAGTDDTFMEAATSLLRTLAGAPQRCRLLGPAAPADAPAGPVEAAAAEGAGAAEGSEAEAGAGAGGGPSGATGGAPPPPPPSAPLQQLGRLVAFASELWGLPLATQAAAGGEEGEGSA